MQAKEGADEGQGRVEVLLQLLLRLPLVNEKGCNAPVSDGEESGLLQESCPAGGRSCTAVSTAPTGVAAEVRCSALTPGSLPVCGGSHGGGWAESSHSLTLPAAGRFPSIPDATVPVMFAVHAALSQSAAAKNGRSCRGSMLSSAPAHGSCACLHGCGESDAKTGKRGRVGGGCKGPPVGDLSATGDDRLMMASEEVVWLFLPAGVLGGRQSNGKGSRVEGEGEAAEAAAAAVEDRVEVLDAVTGRKPPGGWICVLSGWCAGDCCDSAILRLRSIGA